MQTNKKLKIGLALGGGSALGFAHIGVIRALEENDISIDCISGTSFGAMIATLYAFGASLGDLEREAEALKTQKLIRAKLSISGVASNALIEKIIKKYAGQAEIEKADIPLSIIATNIENGEKVILQKGNATKAVLASSCIPGLFSPVEIDGQMMVDGGITENVPLSPLKNLGAEIIIGVNLFKYRKYKKPKNIVDVLVNSFDIVNHSPLTQPGKEDANFLIEPNLGDFYMSDFKKWKEISEIGYRETLKFIPEIKKYHEQPIRRPIWKKINKIIKKIL